MKEQALTERPAFTNHITKILSRPTITYPRNGRTTLYSFPIQNQKSAIKNQKCEIINSLTLQIPGAGPGAHLINLNYDEKIYLF